MGALGTVACTQHPQSQFPSPRLYPMGPSAQASEREDRIGTRREERVVWSSTTLYDGFTHSGVAEGAYVRSRRAEDFFSLRGRHPVSDLVWRQGQDQTMSRPSLFIDWTPPRPGVPQERSLACRHYAGHQWGCAAVFFPSLSCPIRPYRGTLLRIAALLRQVSLIFDPCIIM